VIDEMWHAFVLFTQFYIEFCEKYFTGGVFSNSMVSPLTIFNT